MDATTKACLEEMKVNANLIGSRIQDLIDAATLENFKHGNVAVTASTDAEINAALAPVAQALRMLAHPSSNTSAT